MSLVIVNDLSLAAMAALIFLLFGQILRDRFSSLGIVGIQSRLFELW